jgi:hypothetical protein
VCGIGGCGCYQSDVLGGVVLRWLRVLLGALSVALGGCATIHNPLSLQDIAALRIVAVTVSFKPDVEISWVAAEQEFVDRANADRARDPKPRKVKVHDGIGDPAAEEHRRLVASPEGQSFVQNKVAALIGDRLKRDIVPQLNGGREARLEVMVHGFVVPHAIQRATLGGVPLLLAMTTLKDARTGAELAKLDQATAAPAGQGILGLVVDQGSLEDRVLDVYVSQVRNWLLKR